MFLKYHICSRCASGKVNVWFENMNQTKLLVLVFFIIIFFGIFGRIEGDECPVCTQVYNPVCAECNGKLWTYSSDCHLKRAIECEKEACTYKYNGECQNECEYICTMQYKPICAWNHISLKTFTNECMMEYHNKCNVDCFKKIIERPCPQKLIV